MRYYAVIDTNVLVSALLKPASVPGRIVSEAMEGCIIPLYNDAIIQEYDAVLRRLKFKFDRETIQLTIGTVIERGIPIDAGPIDDLFPDPKDVVFYAVTMEKRKTDPAYLVTGNLRHFPDASFIVTPREMLNIIQGGAVRDDET